MEEEAKEKDTVQEQNHEETVETSREETHEEVETQEKHSKWPKKEKCNKEIVELKEQVAELTEKCARAQAEVINFKRRKEEETSLRLKYCNEGILLQLVNVVDNFERAIKMDDNDLADEVSKFLSGFKMMYTNMLEILKANEVVEIACEGLEFDAKVMEAILVEHDDNKPSHVVLEVLQKGYMYKDKILRPAMVKIND